MLLLSRGMARALSLGPSRLLKLCNCCLSGQRKKSTETPAIFISKWNNGAPHSEISSPVARPGSQSGDGRGQARPGAVRLGWVDGSLGCSLMTRARSILENE